MSTKEDDAKIQATMQAAMDKLKAMSDPGHVTRYSIMTADTDTLRVFRKMTRKWLMFWRWFL